MAQLITWFELDVLLRSHLMEGRGLQAHSSTSRATVRQMKKVKARQ